MKEGDSYLQCGPFLGFIWFIAQGAYVGPMSWRGRDPAGLCVCGGFSLPVVSGALNIYSFLTESPAAFCPGDCEGFMSANS